MTSIMVRPAQHLYPHREPPIPRPAATVLLWRDVPVSPQAPQGYELLMTRRSARASFLPNAHVFPGGAVDAADAALNECAMPQPYANDAALLTASVAALRECFEEMGILLARDADGDWVTAADVAQLDRQADLLPQLRARGWRLATDVVGLLAHWVTDRDFHKRFDVPFLLAPMPPGQRAVPDNREQFAPVWISPSHALSEHEAGRLVLVFPTERTLRHLHRHDRTAQQWLAVCQAAGASPQWSSCPRAGWRQGQEVRFMAHEPEYGELALVCPDGQLLHHLDWETSRARPLLRHVQRLTCGNPGLMTGPGTNSYIVGEPNTGYIVIDPGPHDAEHTQRLWQTCGGDIRAIVCTHSHPDHSPGAIDLQRFCQEHVASTCAVPVPPILGRASLPTARPHSRFVPDRELQHNELLTLEYKASSADLNPHSNAQTIAQGIAHTLRVLHTPGHAANHVCLVLEEDGLLFSGDHILNGSTTVIDPPDGHMGDYLASLDALLAACVTHHIEFVLPAHGHVLGHAPQAIAQLKAHRLQREAKVQAAVQALPEGSVADWVRHAYGDVPSRLWPIAERSLLAHVAHLRDTQTPDAHVFHSPTSDAHHP